MPTLLALNMSKSLERALEALFLEHHQMLYRTAYGMLKNPADAEDIPQTIFLRLLHNGIPPNLETGAKRYLYRAAVNLCLDVIRTRKRRKLVEGVEGLNIPIESSSDSLDLEEMDSRLAEALAELRPETVEILVLRYVHNYREAEIAKILGIARGTLAIKLFRARRRLKKLMQDSGG